MSRSRTGRRLCGGAMSFACEGPEHWRAPCHCESRRRRTASAFTTFMGAPDGAWAWTGAAPRTCASGPGVTRMFCGTSGVPVGLRSERLPWVPVADDLRRLG